MKCDSGFPHVIYLHLGQTRLAYILRRNAFGLETHLACNICYASTLGIPNDPIFGGKSLIVLFHSINFSGPSANHYDAIYRLQ